MKRVRVLAQAKPRRSSPDTRLIGQCLKGNEDAWSTLVGKYKNLIFSIPIKYGLPPEEATDIFQAVCLELLRQLPRLREPRALPAWLIQTTSHKCLHWRQEQRRQPAASEIWEQQGPAGGTVQPPEDLLRQIEQEQILRETLSEMPARCRQLIEMLFFESPARPYREVARQLEIATGSMGFIRRRCLDRLRRALEKKGFA